MRRHSSCMQTVCSMVSLLPRIWSLQRGSFSFIRRIAPSVASIFLSLSPVVSCAADNPSPSVDQLKALAEQQERHGQKRDAAQTYEQIIAIDPTTRAVLAPRLVELCLDTRQARPAMAWAKQVMTNTPSPNAYLANVYARLNMTTEAKGILELEIQKAQSPERAWPLRLQLADLLFKSGDTNTARKILREGAAVLPEGPLKKAAEKQSETDILSAPATQSPIPRSPQSSSPRVNSLDSQLPDIGRLAATHFQSLELT